MANSGVKGASNLRAFSTDAIRYWEPMRIAYNLVLALIVVICFAIYFPASKQSISLDGILLRFLLAVLANVAYCAAYVVIFSCRCRDSASTGVLSLAIIQRRTYVCVYLDAILVNGDLRFEIAAS
jgi:hypothetical protein